MSWGGFTIALLATYLLQVGVSSVLVLPTFDPFLLLALLCGLLAPKHDARVAAWIAGLAQDLGSADALGIHAFTLGLSAMLLTRLREIGNVSVWWVAALTAFISAWPGQFIYLLHLHYWAGHAAATLGSLVLTAASTSLVAAALATVINALPWAVHRRRRRFRSIRV